VGGVRLLAGVPTYVATNTLPFLYMFVVLAGLTVLLARAGLLGGPTTPLRLLTLFVCYGLVVTAWRFWSDSYRFGSDNPYPLLMGGLLFVYAFLLAPIRPSAAAVSAAIFVALSPIHLPMLLLAVFVLFGQRASSTGEWWRRNRPLLRLAALSTAAGLVSYLLPWLLIAANSYEAVGSSYLLRSGLDGDTQYFSNLVQASLLPCSRGGCCWLRTPGELLWPAVIPVLIVAVLIYRSRTAESLSWGHAFAFLSTPYFLSLILFPQSVSIHPYLYDHMLLIPAVIVGGGALLTDAVERRLSGTGLLIFLLLSGGLLMANLNGVAQAIVALPR
jgi:hypothetical protein